MSDLSRLLDDVYGDVNPAPAPEPEPAPAPLVGLPDWAVESVLDEAFADWVPGPPVLPSEDAGGHPTTPVAQGSIPRSAFSDLAAAPAVAPEPVAAPEVPHSWCREDDDILPSGRRGGRGSRTARRPAGAGPHVVPPTPIEAIAPQDEPEAAAKTSRFRRRKG